MAARLCVPVLVAALALTETARSDDIQVDFRNGNFDNLALTLMGESAENLVKPSQRGLLVHIPRKLRDPVPIGFAPRGVALQGDFEILVEYELVRYDRPPSGDWVAAGIMVNFWDPVNRVMTVERMFGPDGDNHFTSDILVGGDLAVQMASMRVGEFRRGGGDRVTSNTTLVRDRAGRLASSRVPTSARAGKLRLERSGSTVRAFYTDGSNSFRLLRTEDMGTGTAMITQIGADTSSKEYGIDVLFKIIDVTTEALIDVTPKQVDSSSWSALLLLSVGALCLALAGAAAWTLKRYRSQRLRMSE